MYTSKQSRLHENTEVIRYLPAKLLAPDLLRDGMFRREPNGRDGDCDRGNLSECVGFFECILIRPLRWLALAMTDFWDMLDATTCKLGPTDLSVVTLVFQIGLANRER